MNRISGGRRSRRGSRDPSIYNDDALKEAFNTVDTDRSGQIDRSELTVAIRAMDPHAPDHVIVDMIKFADADADGKVDFGEFKKILLFKPATTTPPTPPPPTSRLRPPSSRWRPAAGRQEGPTSDTPRVSATSRRAGDGLDGLPSDDAEGLSKNVRLPQHTCMHTATTSC